MSCPTNNSNKKASSTDTKGARGSLFSFATIYPEVVERRQIYAGYEAAPQSHIPPQRRAFFVPVRGALSALGAVTGLGVFWVAELKRDPRTPLLRVKESAQKNGTYFYYGTLAHDRRQQAGSG